MSVEPGNQEPKPQDQPDEFDEIEDQEGKTEGMEEAGKDRREELEDITAPAAEPETRWQRYLRLSIRWLAILLIIFGLGVLATAFLFYRPVADELAGTRDELQQYQAQIAELQDEVDRLQSLEKENQTLQDELQKANLHIQILSALSDVNAARLDLAQDNASGAQVDLTNTAETLKNLEQLVGAQQKEAVQAMQSRLDLALQEMDRDSFAAQSDLEVLATNLVQLENTFFANR